MQQRPTNSRAIRLACLMLAGTAVGRDRARELPGQVMGYSAVTVGFAALASTSAAI
jgi:hypothetical protein